MKEREGRNLNKIFGQTSDAFASHVYKYFFAARQPVAQLFSRLLLFAPQLLLITPQKSFGGTVFYQKIAL